MKRAIVLVLDGCGAGAAPDAADFGDPHRPNTLENVWRHNAGIAAPLLGSIGYFGQNHLGEAPSNLDVEFGRLQPLSQGGKDSVTGHWEMMGILVEDRFPTYPNGFPADLMAEFERRIGRKTLGNRPASGTTIIAELGEEHLRTGSPIVYTSADSVFQIAAHEDVIPLEELYRACEIARELCDPYRVGRVIARPFLGKPGAFTRTENRRDYAFKPAEATVLERLTEAGIPVYAVGKIEDIVAHRGVTKSNHTGNNRDSQKAVEVFMKEPGNGLIFANFIDFDMIYGHRRDPQGYADCLRQTDAWLAGFIPTLADDDVLILTADHGNDPTYKGTDHTREAVPVLLYRRGKPGVSLGVRNGYYDIAQSIATLFGIKPVTRGVSFV